MLSSASIILFWRATIPPCSRELLIFLAHHCQHSFKGYPLTSSVLPSVHVLPQQLLPSLSWLALLSRWPSKLTLWGYCVRTVLISRDKIQLQLCCYTYTYVYVLTYAYIHIYMFISLKKKKKKAGDRLWLLSWLDSKRCMGSCIHPLCLLPLVSSVRRKHSSSGCQDPRELQPHILSLPFREQFVLPEAHTRVLEPHLTCSDWSDAPFLKQSLVSWKNLMFWLATPGSHCPSRC